MFDWFDEPFVYYRRFAPMRSGVFDYLARWMDSVDNMMSREFGDFYDSFYTRAKQPSIENKSDKSDNNETKESKESKGTKEIKKTKEKSEQKNKNENENEGEIESYRVCTSMYTNSDGVQHIYREESDSKAGQHKIVETRRIGDKSMTLHRVTNKDGSVEEHETMKNIKDEEVERFKNDWVSRNVPTVKQPECSKNDEVRTDDNPKEITNEEPNVESKTPETEKNE